MDTRYANEHYDHLTRAERFAGLETNPMPIAQILDAVSFRAYVYQRSEVGITAEGMVRMGYPQAAEFEVRYQEEKGV